MVELISYTVIYERDENMWLASVPAVPGCHTQGRTLAQAEARIREALSLWVDNAATARLVNDVRLPSDSISVLATYWAARIDYELARRRVHRATWDAVRVLTLDAHLGVRDTGDLVGLSSQRVQQITASDLTPLIGDEDEGALVASCARDNRFVGEQIWAKSLAMAAGQGCRALGGAEGYRHGPFRATTAPLTLMGEVMEQPPYPLPGNTTSLRRVTDRVASVDPQQIQQVFAKQLQEVAP